MKEMEAVDRMRAGQSHGVVACRETPEHYPSAR